MNLITATILFTCCFFAAANGFGKCEKGASCVKRWQCPEYTPPSNDDDRVEKFMIDDSTNFLCGFDGEITKVCCKKPLRCGGCVTIRRRGSNGAEVVDNYPWIALLMYNTPSGHKFGCGGVLISDRHVLTSAQCAKPVDPDRQLVSVRLGVYNLQKAEDCVINRNSSNCTREVIEAGIERLIPHEKYKIQLAHMRISQSLYPSLIKYDIAVLKLNRSVIPDKIQPVCLPEPEVSLNDTMLSTDAWGFSRDLDPKSSDKILSGLKEVNKTKCGAVPIDRICAKFDIFERNLCIADLGGALMAHNTQWKMSVVGIHSPKRYFGFNQTDCHRPSTFIDVRKYLGWIQHQMLL